MSTSITFKLFLNSLVLILMPQFPPESPLSLHPKFFEPLARSWYFSTFSPSFSVTRPSSGINALQFYGSCLSPWRLLLLLLLLLLARTASSHVKSGEEAESKMDRTDEQGCFGVQEKSAGACFFRESSLQREWKEKRIYWRCEGVVGWYGVQEFPIKEPKPTGPGIEARENKK